MTLASQLALFTTTRKAPSLSSRVSDGNMAGLETHMKFEASLLGEWQQVHKNVLYFDGASTGTGPVALDQAYARQNSEPLIVAGCGTYAQFRLAYAADGGTDPIINVIGLDANGAYQLLRNKSGAMDSTMTRVAATDLRDDYTTPTIYYTNPDDAQTFDLCGCMAIVVVIETCASEAGTIECKLV